MYNSDLYRRSPRFAQELMIAARVLTRGSLREGRKFAELLAEANQTQWLGIEELTAYQLRHLDNVLAHALRHVPAYRELMKGPLHNIGYPISTVLEHLPTRDKSWVRAHGGELHSEAPRKPLFAGSTSGTTGAPLTIKQDLWAICRENSFINRQLAWAGYRDGDRRAWIRGDLIVPIDRKTPPYWRRNRVENMLMFSSYHLSDESAELYLSALAKFGPSLIQAYPSSIGFLASWLSARNRYYDGPDIKGIVTSSESLTGAQQHLIEQRFGCRVFDWYGQFERVAAIGTCEYGTHHLLSDYSFVELRPSGNGLHEIIGTGFNNLAMPLIRYETGDLVELPAHAAPCTCGRHFPVVSQIHGRADDSVVLPDGRQIGRLDHIFKDAAHIVEAQIRQTSRSEIVILIVGTPAFDQIAAAHLLANARERLGSEIRVRIESVPAIERTRSGKFRSVVREFRD